MCRDGTEGSGNDPTSAKAIRDKLSQYLVPLYGHSATSWLEGLSDDQIREHGPELCETYRRWYDRSLPRPDAVIDPRNNEGLRGGQDKLSLTLLLYITEIRRRLSQAGLKRHGMIVFDLYLTRSAPSEEAMLDLISAKTGLNSVKAKRLFDDVWDQLRLVLKQAIKDGNFS